MGKKKRTFHCNDCGTPCTVYKKGKGHRILVCPKCGVLASNPLPLLAIGAAAAPYAIDAVKGLLTKRGKVKTQRETYPEASVGKPTCKRGIFEKAVMLEALERGN
jgi:transcription elongation factor Elf1